LSNANYVQCGRLAFLVIQMNQIDEIGRYVDLRSREYGLILTWSVRSRRIEGVI
jgi:hypothetical protein